MNTGRVIAASITAATAIFIAIGTLHPGKSALEYSGGKNLLRTSSTPQAAVENLGDEIRLRAWKAAYSSLANKAEFTQSDFVHDLTGYYLSRAGIGLSTLVHVGGDGIVGLPLPAVVRRFEADPDTRCVAIFGEIGGSQEERVAEMMASGEVTKPVVAFIGGRTATQGVRFSHAGAIVEGGRGTHAGKVAALRAAGATVVDAFDELPAAVARVLEG
ncbi:MAG: hypothetical protein B7Z68_11515 [Acidobacteria bacterium 21-70-11]|nr:MAG: hypothetical protein B7Z68_11515 [Acidobacteria bacterium 21-70-11]